MLVLALQFCASDWTRAAKLARLLADLERRRRDDVTLLFVRATDFVENPVMDRVFARCSEVFRVDHLVVRPDTPDRAAQWHNLGNWIEGSNILFTAAAGHVTRRMGSQWRVVFFADGGDGAPLHRDWADMVLEDHARTEAVGLQVTGALRDCRGTRHVNGNLVVSREFLEEHPELAVVPAVCQEWDVHHAGLILPAARISSLIYGGWRQFGASVAKVSEISRHSAWWHGCKDGNFVDVVREYLVGWERPWPEIVDLGRASELRSSRFSS